jgi:hypothetical protein
MIARSHNRVMAGRNTGNVIRITDLVRMLETTEASLLGRGELSPDSMCAAEVRAKNKNRAKAPTARPGPLLPVELVSGTS